MEETKKKILNLLLKLREVDQELENIKINGEYVIFYKGNCREVERTENKEIEVDGNKIPAKIEYTECVSYEEKEYDGWLFTDTETEKVVRTGTFVYIPISVLKGENVEEVLKTINIKEELERLEKEKEEEQKRKERGEYILANTEMMMYYYGSELPWKGIKVRDREEAVSKLKEIESRYQLSDEESFNDITVKEFVKGKARIYVIDDKTKGLVAALRDDSWSLLEFIREVIKEIDEGVEKDIGKFEKKVIEGDRIIYYFSEDKGVRNMKILVPFATRLDQHAYEIETDVIWRKAEIPLSFISKFVKVFIEDGLYR